MSKDSKQVSLEIKHHVQSKVSPPLSLNTMQLHMAPTKTKLKSMTAAEKVAERPEEEDYTLAEQARDFADRFSFTLYELLKQGTVVRDVTKGCYYWLDNRSPEQREQHFKELDILRTDLVFDMRDKYLIPAKEVLGAECAQMRKVIKGVEELTKPASQRAFRPEPPVLVTQSNIGSVLVFISCYSRKKALEMPLTGFQIDVDPIFKLDMATLHLKDIAASYEGHMKEQSERIPTGLELYK